MCFTNIWILKSLFLYNIHHLLQASRESPYFLSVKCLWYYVIFLERSFFLKTDLHLLYFEDGLVCAITRRDLEHFFLLSDGADNYLDRRTNSRYFVYFLSKLMSKVNTKVNDAGATIQKTWNIHHYNQLMI